MPRTHQNLNVFVLPSLNGCLPVTILEMTYLCLPVVETDIMGGKDQFEGVALLVSPKNEIEFAEATVKLLNIEELRSKLSEEGEELVKGRYALGAVDDGI